LQRLWSRVLAKEGFAVTVGAVHSAFCEGAKPTVFPLTDTPFP
jgi:hypothetical protein